MPVAIDARVRRLNCKFCVKNVRAERMPGMSADCYWGPANPIEVGADSVANGLRAGFALAQHLTAAWERHPGRLAWVRTSETQVRQQARWPRVIRWADIAGFAPTCLRRSGKRAQKNRPSRDDRFDWCIRRPWTDGRWPMRRSAARRVMRSGQSSADCMRSCAHAHRRIGASAHRLAAWCLERCRYLAGAACASSGRAQAMTLSPDLVSMRSCPPTAATMYCLPLMV